MCTRWPILKAAVVLALGAGSSLPVAAQSAGDDVIAGESATWVTLIEQSCSFGEVQPLTEGAVQRIRGAQTTCDVEFDDPRVSGTVTTSGNYDCHADTGCVTWGQQEITGPDGSWSGTFTGLIDPAFTERAVAVFAGSGGYADLTFVVHGVGPLNETPSVVGLIYEGDAPAQR